MRPFLPTASHPKQLALRIRFLWALSEEAEISPDNYQLELCSAIPLTVTVVCMCDLSQTKAAGMVFLEPACVYDLLPFARFPPPQQREPGSPALCNTYLAV